jgi:hypothetical protein
MKQPKIALLRNMIVLICCAFFLLLQVATPFFPSWFQSYTPLLSALIVVGMFATIFTINKFITGTYLPNRQKYETRKPRPRISNVAGIMIFIFPLIYLSIYYAAGRLFSNSFILALAMAVISLPISFAVSNHLYDRISAARIRRVREKQG